MAADYTMTGPVYTIAAAFPTVTVIETPMVTATVADVVTTNLGGGGAPGPTRPSSGFLYPRGQG